MSNRLLLIFTTLLVLSSRIDSKKSNSDAFFHPDRRIFIDDPSAEESFFEGSGKEPIDTSDDEDIGSDIGSGDGAISGSGDFDEIINPTLFEIKPNVTAGVSPSTTTSKSLTPCQQLLKSYTYTGSVRHVPECTPSGEFQRRQCRGGPGVGDCWCVDPLGKEVAGTRKHPPYVPDCEFGTNLNECVFQLLKHSHGLFGEYRPRCTIDGKFEKIQCKGSVCMCVSENGVPIPDTELHISQTLSCTETTTTSTSTTTVKTPVPTTKKPKDKKKGEKPYEIPTSKNNPDVKIEDTTVKPIPDDYDGDGVKNDGLQESTMHVMKQPGLLAAVIGGAVVGLLCAVLLVMFIVYRMRKKDEGSYALDEPPKYPNYSYTKAQDKEFYA